MKLVLEELSEETQKYFDSKDYNNAFKNANSGELKELTGEWLDANVDYEERDRDNIIELILQWYNAFDSIDPNNNPFINLLIDLKPLKVKVSYNDLNVINNKYFDRVLEDDNLWKDSRWSLLNKKEYWDRKTEDQEFLLDMYFYFSDDNNVIDAIQPLVDNNVKLLVDNEELPLEQYIKHPQDFKDIVVYKEGNFNNNIREVSSIEQLTKDLSKYQNRTTQKIKYKDSRKLKDFIDNNKGKLDKDLLSDIKTWLNSESWI